MASDSTRWTLIRGAADGNAAARAEFARRYESVIRTYLGARWRHTPLIGELDDVCQEVFADCFRPDGPLTRADPERGDFRGFLFGVVRNVARNAERQWRGKREEPGHQLDALPGSDDSLAQVFDRAWALALISQSALLMRARATDEAARKRVALLALRFEENVPIREIARRWETDAALLHHQYARARDEFKSALRDVVAEHSRGTAKEIDAECLRLLSHLS